MKLTISNLTKSYRDGDHELVILDNVSAEFEAHTSTAIVGRSGSGKSTLLHLLGGLDTPTAGSISIGDTKLDSLSADELSAFRGKHIGFVFQFHHLLSEFSAIENVAMPLFIQGVEEEVAISRAKEMLSEVGLAERLTHLPSMLSGGEQQRVAIARAVVTKPAVLLADEPTGSLDDATAKQVQDVLLRVSRDLKTTLVVVTHSKELASHLDTLLEMTKGGKLG